MSRWFALAIFILRLVLTPIVLSCIGVSALFAFEFGSAKGATTLTWLAFGIAGAGLDIIKASLPMLGTVAAHNGDRAAVRGCWFGFAVLTAMSLWCAFGVTALQFSEKLGARSQIASDQKNFQAALDRLRAERLAIPQFDFATEDSVKAATSAVDAAQNAINAADRAVQQECGSVGRFCRQRQTDATERRLEHAQAIAAKAKVIGSKAISDRAAGLDEKIATAEAALSKIDVKTLSKEIDPQAKLLHDVFGISESVGTLLGHAIFALGIEIGSGLGFWLIVGHGNAGRQNNGILGEQDNLDNIITEIPPVDSDADATPVFGSRSHFFNECVVPEHGNRVASAIMYRGYQAWCQRLGVEPMAAQVFGKDAPWSKEKIGGTIYYLNSRMAHGYDAVTKFNLVKA